MIIANPSHSHHSLTLYCHFLLHKGPYSLPDHKNFTDQPTMAALTSCSSSSTLIFTTLLHLLLISTDVSGATFNFVNRCDHTVWPGILSGAGTPSLATTGFELPSASSRSLEAPTGWSGRFWARTGCNFGSSGAGTCQTGDCGSGEVECRGAGAAPPATLAEFTLGSGGGLDFYDVSLVDGFNLPLLVDAAGGGGGACGSTGCAADVNVMCPEELRAGGGGACRSACEAFGTPEYCCSGAYATPDACRPSVYSEMFKSQCPRSYSYAYDDATSTFTCSGADYTITFCPSSPSQKSTSTPPLEESSSTTTTTTTTTQPQDQGSTTTTGSMSGSMSGSVTGSGSGLGSSGNYYSSEGSGSGDSGQEQAIVGDGSWLAGLAMGETSTTTLSSLGLIIALIFSLLLNSL